MKKLIEALEEFAQVDEALQAGLMEVISRKEFSKGHLLLEEGRICRHLGFIEQGLARTFYYKDGKDITNWFGMENDPCVSVASFLTQQPSREYIEVLEDTRIWLIEYQQLQDLYKRFPQLNLIGRLIMEHYFLELEAHTISLQQNTTKERYLQLLENDPEIIQRAPLTHIASFLGMTRENLSRIRRQH